jgi:dienelactone hydrolase
MRKISKLLIILLVYILIFSSLIAFAQLFNTGFGKVKVDSIIIDNEGIPVNGYLYEPKNAEALGNLPAVVLIHGVMNAKETMSGISLELARRGVVALTIDATGHGNTGGRRYDTEDSSLGVSSAIQYLRSLVYVNSSNIGLVGHSMGVSAIRAASLTEGNVKAHIFVGGLSLSSNVSIYGELDGTSPSNLLIAIGQYDEIFDDLEEVKNELKPVFGTSEKVVVDQVYGSFSDLSARKLIIPKTNHLFEPINRKLVRESIDWMLQTFDGENNKSVLLYPYRDIFITISFFLFVGFFIPLASIASDISFFRKQKTEEEEQVDVEFSLWKTGLIWSFLHIVMFVPPILLFGMSAVIIPLSLGFTAIFWVSSLAIVGSTWILINLKRKNPEIEYKEIIKDIVKRFSNWRMLIFALECFLILVIIDLIVEQIPGISMKLIVPLFNNFSWLRMGMLLILLPFMFLFFSVDGIFISGIYRAKLKERTVSARILATTKIVGIKIIPLVLVLLIQYIPLILFDFKILSGFLGFSMQFIIMLLPLFIVYTIITTWLYDRTGTLESGALLNAFLFAWTLATLLPIN